MTHREQLEKTRQAIMRYRELLDLLHQHVDQAERRYEGWFAAIPAEDLDGLPEKQRQGRAAEHYVSDPQTIADGALHLRFVCREFEKEFEQLHDNVLTEIEEE